MKQHKQDWEDLGVLDPFWAILSEPAHQYGNWDIEAFFATGEQEIEQVMTLARQLNYPAKCERALDFGCGLGRTSRALAQYFDVVFGVDISDYMISQAKEICHDYSNLNFVSNNEANLKMFSDDYFDLIYTNRVLQHIPDHSTIMAYIGEFVRILQPKGLIVFQLLSYVSIRRRLQFRRKLYKFMRRLGFRNRFLYETLKLNPIKMNFIPKQIILKHLKDLQADVLYVKADPTRSNHDKSVIYYITKRNVF